MPHIYVSKSSLSCAEQPLETAHRKVLASSQEGRLAHKQFCAGLIRIGYKKPLVQEDLWDLCKMDESKALCSKFDQIFEDTKQKSVACQVCTPSAQQSCFKFPACWINIGVERAPGN